MPTPDTAWHPAPPPIFGDPNARRRLRAGQKTSTGAAYSVTRWWTCGPALLAQALAAGMADSSTAVMVQASHGRWLINCPQCNSAQVAAPTDFRFMCCDCANTDVGTLWRPVIWPSAPDDINVALSVRPAVQDLTWTPASGQSATDIVTASVAAGDVTPDPIPPPTGT